MWDTRTDGQKLLFLINLSGITDDKITHDMIHQAEANLNYAQRDAYVDLVSGEVSVITYRGLTNEQIQSPSTTQRYYFNMIHLSADVKAKCLWQVMNG